MSTICITIISSLASGILVVQGGNTYGNVEYENGQDLASVLPNGIFHYLNRETESDADFKLPQFDSEQVNPMTVANDLLNTISSIKRNEEELMGINLPMPFGFKPLHVKFSRNQESRTKLGQLDGDDEQEVTNSLQESEFLPKMDNRSQEALKNARIECLYGTQLACDQALEKYHQLYYHRSPMMEMRKMHGLMLEEPKNIVTNSLLKWLMPNLKHLSDHL